MGFYTERIYNAIDDYMAARAAARDEYVRTMDGLRDKKGSKYYVTEQAKAAQKRTDAVTAAQYDARFSVNRCIEHMQKSARSIAITPPTQDMINTLTVLKMRAKLTQTELDAAANSMDGNGLALGVLDELAAASGLIGGYSALANKDLTAQGALSEIGHVSDVCTKILDDTTGADLTALMARQAHVTKYGGDVNADGLPAATRYADARAFFNATTHCGYDAFSKAVDG